MVLCLGRQNQIIEVARSLAMLRADHADPLQIREGSPDGLLVDARQKGQEVMAGEAQ